MRIAVVSDWFAEKMGYSENCLPKELASLGQEVHLVTSDVQPYFDSPAYAETYEPFIGPGIVATGVTSHDGYTLHRLPHDRTRGRLRIQGLRSTLARLRPDIVQTFEIPNVSTLETAVAKERLGFSHFAESHIHASVFGAEWRRRQEKQRLRWWAYRRTAGAFVNRSIERCYPISQDAADLAIEWFGISPKKIEVSSLGVDTDLFRPRTLDQTDSIERAEVRAKLGFRDGDIVCIYTGRFASDKGPKVLADAVDELVRHGRPFRGLFVGSGTEAERVALQSQDGCTLHPFVPARDLPALYRAADIGVWPRQESTSQLDAAASGLPIVLSNKVTVRERVDGNGLTYQEGDAVDLALKLASLESPEIRERLGAVGSRKIQAKFSWRGIAERRLEAYAVARNRRDRFPGSQASP